MKTQSNTLISDRTRHVVTAARDLFSRYGVRKTTMGDIAREAGVARQTVYNLFPSKDDVLAAVVKLTGHETLAAVADAWQTQITLDEKLEAFCELGPVCWYQAIHAAPDWEDLLEGVHTIGHAEFDALHKAWAERFEALFQAHLIDKTTDLDIPEIADFFYTSCVNAKYAASDLAHLRQRLKTICAATLALLAT